MVGWRTHGHRLSTTKLSFLQPAAIGILTPSHTTPNTYQTIPTQQWLPTTATQQQRPTSAMQQQPPTTAMQQYPPTTATQQQSPTTAMQQQSPTTATQQQSPITATQQQQPPATAAIPVLNQAPRNGTFCMKGLCRRSVSSTLILVQCCSPGLPQLEKTKHNTLRQVPPPWSRAAARAHNIRALLTLTWILHLQASRKKILYHLSRALPSPVQAPTTTLRLQYRFGKVGHSLSRQAHTATHLMAAATTVITLKTSGVKHVMITKSA
ncbi:Disintegrin and metalloproteinase domain-containing protein 29 [Portunus trituberculatus]|uniref:Disintegrin and metalloproteinase domain-containing protein 29 n=1 Tax=Portunus trituberculatus TaxID=210409 RepID=A0A5B7FAZ4_PORTR|nr:Disintegrin and metalloproteinase domain-containing protein 29 [Portunus trituberculatus]